MFLLILLPSLESLSPDQNISPQTQLIQTTRQLSQHRHSQIQISQPTAQQKKTALSVNTLSTR
jgi:hypothetical protein